MAKTSRFYHPSLAIGLALAGLLSACTAPRGPIGVPSMAAVTPAPKGTLTVMVRHQPQKRVQAVLADVARLAVEVTSWGHDRVQFLDAAAMTQGQASLTFTDLPARMRVTLKALSADGRVIGATSQNVDLSSSQTAQIAMSVQLAPHYLGGQATGDTGLTPQISLGDSPVAGTLSTFSLATSGGRLTPAPTGHVWVMTTGNRMVKVAPDGSVNATAAPLTHVPLGAATDGRGNLWAVSLANLTQFDPDGHVLKTLQVGAQHIAIDAQERIWLASQKQVRLLAPDGTELDAFTLSHAVTDLAIDPVSGVAWFLTTGGSSVVRLSPQGADLGSIPLEAMPARLRVDQAGQAWVLNANTGLRTVQKFAPDGRSLGRFAADVATNMALDASGNLWTVNFWDNANNVAKFTSDGLKVGVNTYVSGGYVRDIACTPTGDIWLLSDRGLARLSP
jgi:sugar lactone lactonase YvrE